MKKIVRISLIVLIATILAQCSLLVGKNAMHTTYYPGTGEGAALVVLFPTIGGDGSLYKDYGLIEEIRARRPMVDVVVLDVKPELYLAGEIVKIVRSEVIIPAKDKGYPLTILVGTSLGGHGAILYATQYPEDVDGVFLFSPFISGPLASMAIEEAGGLEQWEDCPFLAWEHSCKVWKALKDYVADRERRARVFLGYGTEDRFADECRLLGKSLPPENVFTVPGGHNWKTWEQLWIKTWEYLDVARPFQRGH